MTRGFGTALAGLCGIIGVQACATRTVYRPTFPPPPAPAPVIPRAATPPPPSSTPVTPRAVTPPSVAAPAPQAKSLVEPGRIREEELREKPAIPRPRAKEQLVQTPAPQAAPPAPAPAPLSEDGSLLAKITAKTSPQRAASLRLTEEGRKLLDAGEYARALSRLEKTIAIDSTNPYGYYYLAKAQYHLGRYQESLNFLDVAESLLASDPYWLAEVHALKGENFRALGFPERADSSYSQALRMNPGNRVAADGLSRIQGEAQPALR